MVSALYKAATTGDAAQVADLLRDASDIDIEVKDHTGVTPLIQAVRNGHVDVVKILLERGADPNNASSAGRPETYTGDPAIHDLLNAAAAAKSAQLQQHPQLQPSPPVHGNGIVSPPPAPYAVMAPYPPPPAEYYGGQAHYAPHPMSYGAPYPPPFAPAPDGSPAPMNGHAMQYYPMAAPPPPPPGQGAPHMQGSPPAHANGEQQNGAPNGANGSNGNGNNNLPPAHIARGIPCRFYPACRYGSSCMFMHPQTPYFSGPMPPPAQYPQTFDPMSPQQGPYAQPAYYPPHPGPYPPPPVPGSPAQHMMAHSRGPSEIVSPILVSPPLPMVPMPYAMPVQMSPYAAQQGLPPMAMVPGAPPPSHLASPPMFPSSMPMGVAPLPPMSPYHTRRDSITSYHHPVTSPLITPGDGLPTSPRLLQANIDGYSGAPLHHRDGSGHRGRGGRPSMGGPRGKPPCLFYPSGRCRNGEHCRFPHIMPTDGSMPGTPTRMGKPRASLSGMEGKFANMAIRDEPNGNGAPNGFKQNNGWIDGPRGSFTASRGTGRKSPPKPQRVPVAEDFPVLSGSRTPPVQNGVLAHGPTAADIVRAAASSQKAAATAEAKAPVDGDSTTIPNGLENGVAEVPVTA